MNKLLELLKDEQAATMVEYGLIITLISVVGIIATGLAGKEVNTSFSIIGSTLTSANSN